jgi:hypothetical protein
MESDISVRCNTSLHSRGSCYGLLLFSIVPVPAVACATVQFVGATIVTRMRYACHIRMISMVIDRDTANRIAVLRPLLICGVVLLHVPGQVDKPSRMGRRLVRLVQRLFRDRPVPRHGADLEPDRRLPAVPCRPRPGARRALPQESADAAGPLPGLQRRTGHARRPCVQSWNSSWCSCATCCGGAAHDWINALFGVKAVPLNYPLYFLRDLIVLVAAGARARLAAAAPPLVRPGAGGTGVRPWTGRLRWCCAIPAP